MRVIGEFGESFRVGLGGKEVEKPAVRGLWGKGVCESGEMGELSRGWLGLRNEFVMLPTKADIGLLIEDAVEGRRPIVEFLYSSSKIGPMALNGLTVSNRGGIESETERRACWLGEVASADLCREGMAGLSGNDEILRPSLLAWGLSCRVLERRGRSRLNLVRFIGSVFFGNKVKRSSSGNGLSGLGVYAGGGGTQLSASLSCGSSVRSPARRNRTSACSTIRGALGLRCRFAATAVADR